MVATIRAVTTSTIATGNVTVTKPAGTVDGDLLVAICFADPDGAQLTAPGGWTNEGSTSAAAGFGRVYSKVAASEGASYVFTGSGSSDNSVIMYAFIGADNTAPFDPGLSWSSSVAGGTTHTAPSITTVTSDALLICTYWIISGASNSWTAPGGMTEQSDATSGWASNGSASLALSSSGATGTKSATSTVSISTTYGNITLSFAIKAASSPNATATPPAKTMSATKPTPTITASATVTPAADTAAATLPTPTITRTATVAATTKTMSATVFAPTVNTSGNVTISAATIAKSATVFTPTIFLPDARVFASTIAKAKTMVTPTVTASATVTVGTKAMSATVPLPTIMMIEFGDIPLYRVETRLRNGTYVADMPYKNLQFELGWNKAYGIRFEVPMDHPLVTPATLEPGLHEVWVWRNGTVITAGPLWDATVSSESRSISCGAMSLLDYLDVRLIDNVEYNVVAQTTIAWDLIDNSQALTDGNLNIIAGTLSAGVTRSAKWIDFDNKYILEALQDMSDMDEGFDFYIDPATRAFTALYPRPQRDIGLQLTYPHQIRRYSLQIMGKWIRNRVRVTGQDPNYATAVDTSSLSYYGLRDCADSYRDAATVTDLTAFASKVRDKRALPRKYPTCVIDVTDINIFNTNIIKYGDVVRVLINDGYTQFDQDMRYITAQVTVDKQGMETVVLYLQDTRELE